MCTVSFINNNGRIILTSNRDEKVVRPTAIPPKNYKKKNKNIIFPKDSKAGGTWYIVDDKGTVLVLLNGALEKHEVKISYRKSRGLIVLDVIGHDSPREFWDIINLDDIEPFTLVLFEDKRLFQLRWNGLCKESIELDVNKNHIWSSATLYSEEIKKERANWFNAFLKYKDEISVLDMLEFHKNTQKENKENGLVINRNDEMKTLSITQTVIEKNKVIFEYHDLIENKEFSRSFIII
ncbi:NRDE family protein [Flavobacterium sp. T12S277]|uniref:NRDE family protein n=1 Tax=Flavobacterium sp. T12S277 TaxID=3402752 RepID=UPI003AEA6B09